MQGNFKFTGILSELFHSRLNVNELKLFKAYNYRTKKMHARVTSYVIMGSWLYLILLSS
jgi:hypothetical protein